MTCAAELLFVELLFAELLFLELLFVELCSLTTVNRGDFDVLS